MAARVLIVDDSAVSRGLISRAVSEDPYITVAGSAANGQMAISMAKELQPDIIILDIEMPVMDGITALPELLKISPKSKIIIASTLSQRNAEISLKALALGATDYMPKPSAKTGNDVVDFHRELIAKIKALSGDAAKSPHVPLEPVKIAAAPKPFIPPASAATPLYKTGVQALAIASSTGGPQALLRVFGDIKGKLANIPIFITQHMPPTFTTILAEHLTKAGERPCHEAKQAMLTKAGEAYLAPGDFHMLAERGAGGQVALRITQDAPENFCRPAADPMLRSLNQIYGKQLAVLVLTGMGQDGMEGAKAVVQSGGSVIAQNEQSCVVYGMPKAVVDAGICRAVLPLEAIGPYLIEQLEYR